jgi:hypothetical protein
MNKKYLYIFLFGIGFLSLVTIVLFFQSPPQSAVKDHPLPTTSSSNVQNNTFPSTDTSSQSRGSRSFDEVNNSSGSQLSAEDVTKKFYVWYFSSQSDPITSGTYKRSNYLSDSFKENIAGMINPKDLSYDPIFCSKNKTSDMSVDQVRYLSGNTKAQIIVKRNSDGKDIYRFLLEQYGGHWVIYDIICLP